ncbi:flagellar motor switch phosphatase FliY [Bacillus tianshenii]|uniref:flagellar motor switch phosphatase FliY n=1 Tax=Sutcliffiella tianshenii TaxID=1463404 RepID=UPI001CD74E49|nr:flagellar motor switch phosphatase FliY [Bacillus tianshenii]MCA1320915.1 flagellar motor switch phosphatase FliY [Bacillus tianshenii]
MMSDGMLSQDEIDALLRGSDNDNEEPLFVAPNVEDHFSTLEQDALGEIGNISFGSSATALSTLLNQKVEITTPMVSLLEKQQLEAEFPDPYVAIRVNYTEGFTGSNILVVEQRDAAIIADLMLGGNGENPSHEFDEIHLSAVQEAMNQMMGSAATSMSTVFSKKIDISPPAVLLIDFKEGEGKDQMPEDNLLVKVAFSIRIGRLIDSSIMQILPFPFAKELVKELLDKDRKVEEPVVSMPNVTASPVPKYEDVTQSEHRSEDNTYPYSQQKPENTSYQQQANVSQPAAARLEQTVNVQPAVFSNFETAPVAEAEPNNLNMLMDIPLQVTVELGRTRRSVKDILELSSGSVIELDKLAGEPVDILVNNKLIAQGEVVVIDESFGVRVTDIVSQTDRIKKLR